LIGPPATLGSTTASANRTGDALSATNTPNADVVDGGGDRTAGDRMAGHRTTDGWMAGRRMADDWMAGDRTAGDHLRRKHSSQSKPSRRPTTSAARIGDRSCACPWSSSRLDDSRQRELEIVSRCHARIMDEPARSPKAFYLGVWAPPPRLAGPARLVRAGPFLSFSGRPTCSRFPSTLHQPASPRDCCGIGDRKRARWATPSWLIDGSLNDPLVPNEARHQRRQYNYKEPAIAYGTLW
jgi:hypothetical protein